MKKTIRLTEADLHNLIREAINEVGDTENGQYMLGRLAGRSHNDLNRLQRISKYAKNRREGIVGPDNTYSNHCDTKLQNAFKMGVRNYKYCANPDNEWDDGYWDDKRNMWIPDMRIGSKEEERLQAAKDMSRLNKNNKGWVDDGGNPTDTEEILEWFNESIRRAIRKLLR